MNLANSTVNKLKEKGAKISIEKNYNVIVNKYIPRRENSKMNLEYVNK